MATIFNAQEIP